MKKVSLSVSVIVDEGCPGVPLQVISKCHFTDIVLNLCHFFWQKIDHKSEKFSVFSFGFLAFRFLSFRGGANIT